MVTGADHRFQQPTGDGLVGEVADTVAVQDGLEGGIGQFHVAGISPHLAQLLSIQLAHGVPGQGIDKDELFGELIALQLRGEEFGHSGWVEIRRFRHQVQGRHLTQHAAHVLDADAGAFPDAGTEGGGVFDLNGGGFLAAHVDDVVGATQHIDEPVLVPPHQVVGHQPAVLQCVGGLLRQTPIAHHLHLALQRQPTHYVGTDAVQGRSGLLIQQAHLDALQRASHRGHVVKVSVHVEEQAAAGLGGAPDVEQFRVGQQLAEKFLPLDAEGACAELDVAQLAKDLLSPVVPHLLEHQVHGGGDAGHSGAVELVDVQFGLPAEAEAVLQHDGAARPEHSAEDPHPEGVVQRQGQEQDVVAAHADAGVGVVHIGGDAPEGVGGALGASGGAGGEEQLRDAVGVLGGGDRFLSQGGRRFQSVGVALIGQAVRHLFVGGQVELGVGQLGDIFQRGLERVPIHRDGDAADELDGQEGDDVLRTGRAGEHDPVAGLDALGLEVAAQKGGLFQQLAVGHLSVTEDQRHFVRLLCTVPVQGVYQGHHASSSLSSMAAMASMELKFWGMTSS